MQGKKANRLDELNRLRKQVEADREAASRAQGALTELHRRLKEEFGCDDIASARVMLETLERETLKAQQFFDSALEDFDKEFGERL